MSARRRGGARGDGTCARPLNAITLGSFMDADLDRTKEMFASMTADGLDLSVPLRWGYFLFHAVPEPLAELSRDMAKLGYSYVSLHETEDGEWVLQLAKMEIHTADSLHRRNIKFNELADQRGIDLYDGWDVAVPGATNEERTPDA